MPSKKIPRSELPTAELERQRVLSRAADRRRRERDPEKVRAEACARTKKYYVRHRERLRAKENQDRALHRERQAEYWQRYYLAHQDEIVLQKRVYRAEHPEKAKAADKKWKSTHHDQCLLQWSKRRARKRNAPINDFTLAEWRAMCKAVAYRCAYCAKKCLLRELTQDHITPLAKGGAHTKSNIIPACKSCNSRKRDKAVLKPVQPFLLLPEDLAE